ncbi:MAG: hypothetical protein HF973_19415 [Chloroflexi bacterium]|nr:hypothetical protein [Chloroflexota bacterium]
MAQYQLVYKEQLYQEIEATPEEYWPALLNIVRSYRQSVALNPAGESFRQGWQEAMQNNTLPVSELWDDVEAE